MSKWQNPGVLIANWCLSSSYSSARWDLKTLEESWLINVEDSNSLLLSVCTGENISTCYQSSTLSSASRDHSASAAFFLGSLVCLLKCLMEGEINIHVATDFVKYFVHLSIADWTCIAVTFKLIVLGSHQRISTTASNRQPSITKVN